MRKYDVAYFTASVDPVEKNTRFAKSLNLDYPILSDPDKSVSKAWGCLNDRGFTNRWTYFIGKDGKVLHIEKGVKAASHADQIVAKLNELGVEKKQ